MSSSPPLCFKVRSTAFADPVLVQFLLLPLSYLLGLNHPCDRILHKRLHKFLAAIQLKLSLHHQSYHRHPSLGRAEYSQNFSSNVRQISRRDSLNRPANHKRGDIQLQRC